MAFEILLADFTEHEKRRGIRSLRKIKYELQVLFTYLEEHEVSLVTCKLQDAQNYQTYLVTLQNEQGKVHYATASVQSMINTTCNFFEYLKKQNRIYMNPFLHIKKVKSTKKIPLDTPDERGLHTLLEYVRCFWKEKNIRLQKSLYKLHVISELMYASGLRLSEVAGLQAGDIDFERGIIRVREGKGGKERTAYVHEYALSVLKLFIQKMRRKVLVNKASALLFGVEGARNLEAFLNRTLAAAAQKAGLKRFTSHMFRHCIGYHLLRRGCDIRYIQLILGHDNLNSTMIYTKVDKHDLKQELDRFHPRRFRSSSHEAG